MGVSADRRDAVNQGENGTGRTHEPNLRELTAELDGVREVVESKINALREVVDERHERYGERDQAREKAITKAEDAQREYNVRSNEFRGQLDDQAKMLMPRSEVLALLAALDGKMNSVKSEMIAKVDALDASNEKTSEGMSRDIRELRESRSEGSGKSTRSQEMWGYVVGAIGLILTLASLWSLSKG